MANIRTARRSGLVLRGGRNRRETIWIGNIFQQRDLAAGTPVIDASLNAAALLLRPFTVVRARGFVHVASDQVAATEEQMGAYGAAVVSDEAVAVGVTAVPTPVNEAASDLWFMYQPFANQFTFVSSIGFDGTAGQNFDIDSRAMRKVEDGQDIVFVLEASAAGNAARVLTSVRLLAKLH